MTDSNPWAYLLKAADSCSHGGNWSHSCGECIIEARNAKIVAELRRRAEEERRDPAHNVLMELADDIDAGRV